MSDDGLDRMWGDSPDRSDRNNEASPTRRDRTSQSPNGDAAESEKSVARESSRGSQGRDARQDDRVNPDSNLTSPQGEPTHRRATDDVSETGPQDKENIATRKKQFVIREDQDRALNRALASESCEYGDNRSDIIQALLDLHGFHE